MLAGLVGIGLAVGVSAVARLVGFDRDRAFYPTVLIVVGSYYVLFAVMAGATRELAAELAFFVLFAVTAVLGFRTSQWIVVAGLAAHGVFDFVRESVAPGSGAPQWWPAFCGAYDVAAAALLAAIILAERNGGRHAPART